jgi:hypothetical protein
MKGEMESQSDAPQPQHQTQEQQHPDSPVGSSIGEKAIDSPPFPLQVKSTLLQLVAPVIFHLPSAYTCGVQSTPIASPQSDCLVFYNSMYSVSIYLPIFLALPIPTEMTVLVGSWSR